MAKKVTRTVDATEVYALVLDKEHHELYKENVMLPGLYKDNKAVTKALDKLETENKKYVDIISVSVSQKRYGMDEALFLSMAEEMPLLKGKEEDTEENEEN